MTHSREQYPEICDRLATLVVERRTEPPSFEWNRPPAPPCSSVRPVSPRSPGFVFQPERVGADVRADVENRRQDEDDDEHGESKDL